MAKRNLISDDLLAGATFTLLGLAGLWLMKDLKLGRLADMGPSYLPVALSAILIAFGGTLAVRALVRGDGPLTGWAWRPLLVVMFCCLLFWLALEPLGLFLSVAAVVIVSSWAASSPRLHTVIPLALVAAFLSTVIFVWLLGLPAPTWPQGVPW